ncbi:MAG: LPS export ABC transporter periplasmic protein LptC [Desulfuromonadales bacterium]|nr:LPS export ABC transporter periplasmic protein LptC [Desulfuromonadales bacterium]
MRRKLPARHLLIAAILILSAALAVVVARNYRGPSPEEMIAALPSNIDLSLQEISYTETRDGVRRWTLDADSAAHSAGDGITRIENIHMRFYDLDGLGDLTVTAREGEFWIDDREVEVRGDVVVTSPRGYELYTDRLRYREAERLATTESPVRMVSTTMEVTGTGMRLDLRDQTVSLLSQVRAHIAQMGRGPG